MNTIADMTPLPLVIASRLFEKQLLYILDGKLHNIYYWYTRGHQMKSYLKAFHVKYWLNELTKGEYWLILTWHDIREEACIKNFKEVIDFLYEYKVKVTTPSYILK